MTPFFYSKVAQRLSPVRWWLLAASIAAISLIVAAIAYLGQRGFVVAALAGPLIGLPWAGLCAATWFHPERGNVQPGSKLVGRLPQPLQSGIRWYAAIFLTFFVVACGLVWPLFALSALSGPGPR
jgi:hypothetical protein